MWRTCRYIWFVKPLRLEIFWVFVNIYQLKIFEVVSGWKGVDMESEKPSFSPEWHHIVTSALCEGIYRWPVHSPQQGPVLRKTFPCRDVIMFHDDVIKLKPFRVTGPLWGESTGHRWIPLHKDQWRGAWIFSVICAWTNGWANNRDAGDLRRHRAHYDVTVMLCFPFQVPCG